MKKMNFNCFVSEMPFFQLWTVVDTGSLQFVLDLMGLEGAYDHQGSSRRNKKKPYASLEWSSVKFPKNINLFKMLAAF